ncbi:LysM peptidoglycan-binding domain-containing protein [Kocuria sp. M1R5S2]|uniref:LysM peptidoglycan-binding domain-containing protein n=1 Tax=Kocuria rhizosphaerae TaxID=3376285 RepID=UPI0037B71E4A
MSASTTLGAVRPHRHPAGPPRGRPALLLRPAAEAPAPRAPLTLTRRGRLVLLGLPVLAGSAALVVLAVVFLVPSTATATSGPVPGAGTEVVTVFPGQSLWELALAAEPDRDPRDVVDEIVELNDLRTSRLVAGQQLEVPAV